MGEKNFGKNFGNMKKKNKFNARKCEYKGMLFDSKAELDRYLELKDMENRGLIECLERQIEYEVIHENDMFSATRYKLDFQYRETGKNPIWHFEDKKGLRKGAAYELFKLKKKLMYDRYRIFVEEI